MKKMAVLLSFLILFAAPWCATAAPQKMAEYQGATLYQEQQIRIVDLHGSFYEMGLQYGYLLRAPLIQFSKEFKKRLGMNAVVRTMIAMVFEARMPAPEKEFFKGMSKATGIKPRDLILLDDSIQLIFISLDIQKAFGCSVIAASGTYTKGGQMIIGRNFDWIKEYYSTLSPYLTVAVFHPDQGNAFATLGYLGANLSAVTAMNDHGLFLELNSGVSAMGPYMRFDRASYFPELMNMMWQSDTFSQLQDRLLATPPEEGYLVTIADAKQAATIELSSAFFAKPFARVRPEAHRGLLMTTNSYRIPGWRNHLFTKMYNPISSTQSFVRYDHLEKFATQNKGEITVSAVQNFLTRSITEGGVAESLKNTLMSNPDYTYYSLVAIPSQLEWQVYTQDHPAWVVIDLKPFL